MESQDVTLIELDGDAEENFDQASVLPPAQPLNAGNTQIADQEKSVQVLSTIQEVRDKFDKRSFDFGTNFQNKKAQRGNVTCLRS